MCQSGWLSLKWTVQLIGPNYRHKLNGQPISRPFLLTGIAVHYHSPLFGFEQTVKNHKKCKSKRFKNILPHFSETPYSMETYSRIKMVLPKWTIYHKISSNRWKISIETKNRQKMDDRDSGPKSK